MKISIKPELGHCRFEELSEEVQSEVITLINSLASHQTGHELVRKEVHILQERFRLDLMEREGTEEMFSEPHWIGDPKEYTKELLPNGICLWTEKEEEE